MIFELIKKFLHTIYDIPSLIAFGGYFILFAIIFAETGLMVGFFLPGDSLIVIAGLFAAKGDLNVFYLIILLSIAAITGDSLGYLIGKKAGHALFHKRESKFFRRKHLIATQHFYERHGGKTIFIARFVPIIRTFAPVVAGIAEMDYRKFLSYNIFGGIFWVTSMALIGYFLGSVVPNIEENIHYVAIIIIILSIIPIIYEYLKHKHKKYKIKHPKKESEK